MRTLVYLCFVIFITSCETGKKSAPLEYIYAEKKQVINCENQNNALLNEALYSFENDIIKKYDRDAQRVAYAYANFIMPGITGTVDFKRLASDHSQKILQKLIEEEIIIPNVGTKSNLNYTHPAVSCIIDASEDTAIKQTLESLIKVGGMDPSLFDTRLVNKGPDLYTQRNLALYVALDAYYQNLADVDFSDDDVEIEKK